MQLIPSRFALHALRSLTRPSTSKIPLTAVRSSLLGRTGTLTTPVLSSAASSRSFSSSPTFHTTLNQVRVHGRKPKKARRLKSPAMRNRPAMKGVCLKIGITKPKKPNSGQRKTAKVRLSSGRIVSAYIPGQGHNVMQHNVVLVRGGRAQDCPGVGYHIVRGSMDCGGVAGRIRARSKYGTKKPKVE
ncbi:ribosomal protein S12 [Exophiala mesophila]|uniref:Ribosomal protein S12 n=1 Tax=Exophiala mesophila TaxID=212818 RepID=A0A0D1WV89_EXOME|nr:ribosomal protein S12 [Exophiala mesophila]KIV93255.1 ribosomal protein S12 [Exophiala mesophila]